MQSYCTTYKWSDIQNWMTCGFWVNESFSYVWICLSVSRMRLLYTSANLSSHTYHSYMPKCYFTISIVAIETWWEWEYTYRSFFHEQYCISSFLLDHNVSELERLMPFIQASITLNTFIWSKQIYSKYSTLGLIFYVIFQTLADIGNVRYITIFP